MSKKKIPTVEQLDNLLPTDIYEKYFFKFSKQAAYMGGGVYHIPGTTLFSADTRNLFLMYCAAAEGIEFANL
jgi:hypothetical protein